MRGGSWFNHAGLLRSSSRTSLEVESRYSHYGLRVARMIKPQNLTFEACVFFGELASAEPLYRDETLDSIRGCTLFVTLKQTW